MIEDETNILESLGLKVDVLDVSTASFESIVSTLTKNDIIFVGGGNTFYLLQELRGSGADKILVQEVNKGKLYIGESAGAVIACPDIGYCIGMDNPEKAAEKAVKEYNSRPDLEVITDKQVIQVEDKSYRTL